MTILEFQPAPAAKLTKMAEICQAADGTFVDMVGDLSYYEFETAAAANTALAALHKAGLGYLAGFNDPWA